jgi:hypothetical protein
MKNPQKVKIYDMIDYLVCEYQAKVTIAYDEITIFHTLFGGIGGHRHYRYNSENIIEVMRKIIGEIDGENEQAR